MNLILTMNSTSLVRKRIQIPETRVRSDRRMIFQLFPNLLQIESKEKDMTR